MADLKAIFYARFHPARGPSVIAEYPLHAVSRRASKKKEQERHEERDGSRDREDVGDTETHAEGGGKGMPLVDWEQISGFVIPPYELCGKSLSVCVRGSGWEEKGRGKRHRKKNDGKGGSYRVMGWPISLESEKYERNRFTFNVCFVVSDDDGARKWDAVVKKTALFLQALEVEDGILAAEEETMESNDGEGTIIARLLKDLFVQLTTHAESCIRLTSTHTLNLRLPQPPHSPPSSNSAAPPQKLQVSHVPLLIRALPPSETWTPDLVLGRILPHIKGINHLARIADKGSVELKLVKRAVRGLLDFGLVRVLDLFHYQAGYALTGDWKAFVTDEWGLTAECVRYVCASTNGEEVVTRERILTLYAALSASQSVHDFVLANHSALAGTKIDVRRFVTFGVLKGFLRRVHKYAIAISPSNTAPLRLSGDGPNSGPGSYGKFGSGSGGRRSVEDAAAAREVERAWRRAALSSGWATPPGFLAENGEADPADGVEEPKASSSPTKKAAFAAEQEMDPEDARLMRFLDGKHCLDEICVALRLGEGKVVERLRSGRFGEVVVFSK